MKRGHVPPAVPLDDYFDGRLRDPEIATAYLSMTAADENPAAFMLALRRVTDAHGGMTRMARLAGVNRQQLYRTLSAAGNPELRTLVAILRSIGFGFAVKPLDGRVRLGVARAAHRKEVAALGNGSRSARSKPQSLKRRAAAPGRSSRKQVLNQDLATR